MSPQALRKILNASLLQETFRAVQTRSKMRTLRQYFPSACVTLLGLISSGCSSFPDDSDTSVEDLGESVQFITQSATGAIPSPNEYLPGHYILTQKSSNQSNHLYDELDNTILTNASFNTKFKGFQVRFFWSNLEGNTKGSYDWSVLSNVLDRVPTGKKLYVQLQFKTFQAGLHAVPTYLQPGGEQASTGYDAGYDAKIWTTDQYAGKTVNQHFLDLIEALGNWVKSQSAARQAKFGGLVFPETACDGCWDNEASRTNYMNAVKAQITTTKASLPTKYHFFYMNFLPGPDNSTSKHKEMLCQIANHACVKRVGIGGPDVRAKKNCPDNGVLYNPPSFDVIKEYITATGNQIPINMSVQGRDYEYPETFSSVKSTGITDLQTNYFVWLNKQGPLGSTCGTNGFDINTVYSGVYANMPSNNMAAPSWPSTCTCSY
jgi:hypothetical protein